MKKIKSFIGIDVSKKQLDFGLIQEGKLIDYGKTENKTKNIYSFLEKFFKSNRLNLSTTVFCIEHTGIYNNPLLESLLQHKANIWLENPIHIKRSLGLVRGKNDKIDAQRIALFAFRNQDNVKLWQPERKVITVLKTLLSVRGRLLQAIENLNMPLQEAANFMNKDISKQMKVSCQKSLNALRKDVANVNIRIKQVIDSDCHIKQLFQIVSSVDNVGLIVSTAVIVATNEFKKFNNPKKFACYSGVAPFEYSSGTSVRGKTRVSHMANKNIKTLLHLSALSSVSRPGEMKDYFDRKVAEGKNKMLILNAIRNKIILRIFACVNQNKLFEKKYQNNLVLA